MNLILQRKPFGAVNTKGRLTVYLDNGSEGPQCDTLELAWRDNKDDVSCIPAGIYTLERIKSAKLGWCFAIYPVDGRQDIRLHRGNHANSDNLERSDVHGCILAGAGYSDINTPGIDYILNSSVTMNGLLTLLGAGKYQFEVRNAECSDQ